MTRVFEREVAVFPVVTGTAANALALSTLCPQHGAILCHAEAHIAVDECGAPEFFTHGAKLVALEGRHGKLDAARDRAPLKHFHKGSCTIPNPPSISLTQASEFGTVYTLGEIAEIAARRKAHGLKLHMDGARFANALAHLGCTPAEMTWKAGVDALSFGATKNGALCAEAVVFFDPADVRDFEYRRKKSGHLLSKMRFVSAQLVSYLENDRWLAIAARANGLAKRLAQGLAAVPGAEIAHPVEANAIFVHLPDKTIASLRASGARFLRLEPAGERTHARAPCHLLRHARRRYRALSRYRTWMIFLAQRTPRIREGRKGFGARESADTISQQKSDLRLTRASPLRPRRILGVLCAKIVVIVLRFRRRRIAAIPSAPFRPTRTQMRTEEPRAVRLQDYRAPDFHVSEIALDFVLDPETTKVTARMQITRTGKSGRALVLNGEHLKLLSVAIDGKTRAIRL